MLYGLPPFYSRDTHAMYSAILTKPLKLKATVSKKARGILEGVRTYFAIRNFLGKTYIQPEWIRLYMHIYASSFIRQQLLQKDPRDRLGAGLLDGEDVKKDEFFKDIDWDKVEKRAITPPFVPSVVSWG